MPLYEERSALYCSNRHPLFRDRTAEPDRIAEYDAVVPSYAQTPEIRKAYESLKPMASATECRLSL